MLHGWTGPGHRALSSETCMYESTSERRGRAMGGDRHWRSLHLPVVLSPEIVGCCGDRLGIQPQPQFSKNHLWNISLHIFTTHTDIAGKCFLTPDGILHLPIKKPKRLTTLQSSNHDQATGLCTIHYPNPLDPGLCLIYFHEFSVCYNILAQTRVGCFQQLVSEKSLLSCHTALVKIPSDA